VQIFLRERTVAEDRPDVRRAALTRAYGGLLALTLTADARLPSRTHLPPDSSTSAHRPPGDDDVVRQVRQDPVGWLETELSLLVAAVRDLDRLHQTELAARLTSSLTNFFESRSRLAEWRQCLSLGCMANLPVEVDAAIRLSRGQQLFHSGHHRQAVVCLRRARRAYRLLDDARREAVAATALAVAARAVGVPRLAAAAFQRSLDLYGSMPTRPDGPFPQEAWAHLGLGNLRLEFDTDLVAARRHYARAVELFRASGDRRGEANTLGCLSAVDRREGRTGEAIANGESSVALFEVIGDRVNRATAEASLAFDLVASGQFDAARRLLDRAEAMFRRPHNPWGIAKVLRARGRLLLADGNPTEAIATLDLTIEKFEALGQPIGVADALRDLARAHLAAGDRPSARAAADRAYPLYASFGNQDQDRVETWLHGLDDA